MPYNGIEERYHWYRIEVREALAAFVSAAQFRRVGDVGSRAPQLGRLRFAGVRYRLAAAGVRFHELRDLVQTYFGVFGVLSMAEGTVALMLMGEVRRAAPDARRSVKVGRGHRVTAPSDAEWWDRTLAEDREESGRLTNLQRWEYVGDFALAVYDLLSRRIPAPYSLRAFEAGRIATTYNTRALRLTARTMNRLFGETNRKPFTGPTIASRLQARARRAVQR